MNGLIGILCLIWGFNWVIMKLGNGVFPPVMFAALRFLTGSAVLLGVAYFKHVPLPSKRDLKWYILCGLLQTTYFNIAIQISLNYISTGLTSVLTYSMPLFLSIMAHRWIPGEQLTPRKTVGIVVGILGLCLALNVHWGGSFWAVILALSSALSWAGSNVIIKLKLKHCDNVQFTTWQMAIGAVGLLFYSASFEQGEYYWSVMAVVYILFAGIVASALAFVMWYHVLSKTEASKASISLLLVPVVGVISGYVFLHETMKGVTLVGILLVLVGIWIVNGKNSSQTQAVKSPVEHSL